MYTHAWPVDHILMACTVAGILKQAYQNNEKKNNV